MFGGRGIGRMEEPATNHRSGRIDFVTGAACEPQDPDCNLIATG